MSYLDLLDQARRHLERADLIAAEDAHRKACEEWKSSRLRAPLVERGIDPVLRRVGRLFGRDADAPILPVFAQRAQAVQAGLADLVRLLRSEVDELLAQSPTAPGEPELEILERALLLNRASSGFRLDGAQLWPIARMYLGACRRLVRGPRADLLPQSAPVGEDAPWWGDWCEAWLRAPTDPVSPVATWALGQAEALGAAGSDDSRGRWLALASRLALLGPGDAGRALRLGREALSGPLDPSWATDLLRRVAGLTVNEHELAGSGADADARLEEWREIASRLGLAWPPADLRRMREKRRPVDDTRCVAALQWSSDVRRLCFVLHDHDRPCDVLLVELVGENASASPFAATVAEARGWVSRWLPTDAVLLVPDAVPGSIAGMLGTRPRLEVAPFASLFSASALQSPAAQPSTAHPAWNEETAGEWYPLVRAARELLPHVVARLDRPAWSSRWGRDDLRRLASGGLGLASGMVRLLDRLLPLEESRDDEPARWQEVPLSIPLRWPLLADRRWIPTVTEHQRAPISSSDALVWWDGPASPEELGVWAAVHSPSRILVSDDARALGALGAAASRVDPRRVGRGVTRDRCPESLFGRLEAWLTEALAGDLGSASAFLWLWSELAETCDADLDALEQRAPAALRASLQASPTQADGCGEGCRLRSVGEPCLSEQRTSRREQSLVWVETLGASTAALDAERLLVVDDLRGAMWGRDEEVLARLAEITQRIAEHERVLLVAPSGPLGSRIERALDPLAPGGRSWERCVPETGMAEVTMAHAPAGYAPGTRLLAAEARRLLVERERRARVGAPEDLVLRPMQGVASALPEAQRNVVVGALAEEDAEGDTLILLRAAAAASLALEHVTFLDPRLARALAHPEASWGGQVSADLDEVLAPGAELLAGGDESARRRWRQPLDADRFAVLADVSAFREARCVDLARCLRDQDLRRPVVIGGATEAERDLVLRTIEGLATESLDGGPLQLRCVVEFVEDVPVASGATTRLGADDAARLDAMLLGIERGRIGALSLHPQLMQQANLLAWAARCPHVAWVLRHGERILADPAAGRALSVLRDAVPKASGGLAVFVDDPGREAHGVLETVARDFALRAEAMGSARLALAGWTWTRLLPTARIELTDPSTTGRAIAEDLSSVGDDARTPLLHDELANIEAAFARHFAVVDVLRRTGPQAEWTLVCDSEEERDRIAVACGIQASAVDLAPAEGDLAWNTASSYTARCVIDAEMWRQGEVVGDVAWSNPPRDAASARARILRLRAQGRAVGHVEVFDAPLADGVDPRRVPAATQSWVANRVEVEMRLRQVCERVRRQSGPRSGFASARWLRDADLHHADSSGIAAALGPLFAGSDASAHLEPHRIQESPHRRAALAIFQWALEEGLVSASRPSTQPSLPVERRWQRVWRQLPSTRSVAVVEQLDPLPVAEVRAPSSPVAEASFSRTGMAGNGKTTWLREQVYAGDARRTLVVVASATARLGWQADARGPVEVATLEEVALAAVPNPPSSRPAQLLPGPGRLDAEEIRLELMRETSRRYAASAGRVPPVESHELRRVVEGRSARSALAAVAGETGLDPALLEGCARDVRREKGWLIERDLRELATEALAEDPDRTDPWRRFYRSVALDDSQSLAPDLLGVLDALLSPEVRSLRTIDPILAGSAHVESPALETHRLPRELLSGIEDLWRASAPLPGRLKSRRRGRRLGRLETSRTINISAVTRRLVEIAEQRSAETRMGVVVATDSDRARLLRHLREAGHPALSAGLVSVWASQGPRELLAALGLFDANEDEVPVGLEILLPFGPDGAATEDAEYYAGRFASLMAGDPPRDRVEAWLSRLRAARTEAASRRLRGRAELVLACGILDALSACPLSSQRLARFLDDHGHRDLEGWSEGSSLSFLRDPCADHDHIWVLHPDELMGLEFDHLVHVGTGNETPLRHYAVLAHARREVTVLYSERDPFLTAR